MSIDNLQRLMQQLNFSYSMALVYATLLSEGPLMLEALRAQTVRNRENLVEILELLLKMQLINKDRDRNKILYYASHPEISWLALEADLVWQTDNSLKPVRSILSTDDKTTDSLRKTCRQIVSLSKRLYKPYTAALHHREHDAESIEEMVNLTCETIFCASKNICAVSKSPRLPHVAQFWTVLSQRMENGVKYKRIADLDEVIDHGLKVVNRDMKSYGVDLRIIEKGLITSSFYLVDKHYLAIFHQHDQQEHEGRRGVGRITIHPEIVARYGRAFQAYYAKSIPGQFVMTQLQQSAKTLLKQATERFSKEELNWLKSLVGMGKFSTFHKKHKWSQTKLVKTIERGVAIGIIRLNHEGNAVPLYPIDEQTIRLAWIESGFSDYPH